MLVLLVSQALAAAPRASDGVLDLRSWDLAEEPARLDGEWDFAPGVLLEPSEPWPDHSGPLKVPGSWTGKEVDGQTLESEGVGTYRLRVQLPEDRPEDLALRTSDIAAAFVLTVDGEHVSQLGVPAMTADATVGQVHPHAVSFEHEGQSLELRVTVANFDHRKGGIRRPILLGDADQLQRSARSRVAFDAVVAAFAVLIGLYHLLLWAVRPSDRTNLAFASFALMMGFRGMLVGETLFAGLLFPDIPYSWRIVLEYVSMNAGFPLLWWIMRAMFPREVPRWLLTASVVVAAPLVLLPLLTSPLFFTKTVLLSRALMLLSIPLSIAAVSLAAWRGRDGAGLILVGQLALSAAVVHDILFHSGSIQHDIEVGTLGFVCLLTAQALVLAFRYSRSFARVEKLSRELSVAHAYNEGILFSLRSGVLTFDLAGRVAKANAAAGRILGLQSSPEGQSADTVFGQDNGWVLQDMAKVRESGKAVNTDDSTLVRAEGTVSANVSLAPLTDTEQEPLGLLMLLDDVSAERRLKATMARYMSREVAERLIAGGEQALSGQLSEATVLFSDIRKFSTVSEGLGPKGTVQMLNEYFTIMVDEVFNHEGILDKYIGDAIMAVFGALGSDENHALRALRCSVGMLRLSEQLNLARVARGDVAIAIGIGLNTDQIVHGNIGSPMRMDYTVIGDGVNLAARLESANVTYGTQLLISEFTLAAVPEAELKSYLHRELDLVAVKGKTQAVRVFEVLEHRRSAAWEAQVAAFDEALGLYRSREWRGAAEAFAALVERIPEDGPARLYRDRCQHFVSEPPPADWDGVWRMKTK
jgi:class 3 adenylate cyclase/PAS domain-containing protein